MKHLATSVVVVGTATPDEATAVIEPLTVSGAGAYTAVFDSKVITAATVQPDDATFTPFGQDDLITCSPDWTEDQAAVYTAIMAVGELPVTLVPA